MKITRPFDVQEQEATQELRDERDARRERFQEMSLPRNHVVTLFVRYVDRDGSPVYTNVSVENNALHELVYGMDAKIVEAHAESNIPVDTSIPF